MRSGGTLPLGRGGESVADWPFALEELVPGPEPEPEGAVSDPVAVARRAVPALAAAVGGGRVAVAVPDRTRPFPRRAILEPLLAELRMAGVSGERVDLLVARGLHAGEAPSDLAGLAAAVHLHDPRAGDLVDLGSACGVPAGLNRRWVEAAARLGLGTAGFHYLAGFGGGRKTIAPGLAGERTIVGIHRGAVGEEGRRHPGVGCGRLDGNPLHERAAAVVRLAPPTIAVEALGTAGGESFLVGDPDRVHRAGARWVKRARSLAVPEPRRLVLASAGGHPRDRDLIQSHKALEHVRAALHPGGSVVLFAACEDGAGHPDLLAYGRRGDAGAIASALDERFAVYGQTAWSLKEKTALYDVVLVSRLDEEEVRALGMRPASSAAAALRAVRESLPDGEPGWVVRDAGARIAVAR